MLQYGIVTRTMVLCVTDTHRNPSENRKVTLHGKMVPRVEQKALLFVCQ